MDFGCSDCRPGAQTAEFVKHIHGGGEEYRKETSVCPEKKSEPKK